MTKNTISHPSQIKILSWKASSKEGYNDAMVEDLATGKRFQMRARTEDELRAIFHTYQLNMASQSDESQKALRGKTFRFVVESQKKGKLQVGMFRSKVAKEKGYVDLERVNLDKGKDPNIYYGPGEQEAFPTIYSPPAKPEIPVSRPTEPEKKKEIDKDTDKGETPSEGGDVSDTDSKNSGDGNVTSKSPEAVTKTTTNTASSDNNGKVELNLKKINKGKKKSTKTCSTTLTKPVGIRNDSANCWAISMLQALRVNDDIREFIRSSDFEAKAELKWKALKRIQESLPEDKKRILKQFDEGYKKIGDIPSLRDYVTEKSHSFADQANNLKQIVRGEKLNHFANLLEVYNLTEEEKISVVQETSIARLSKDQNAEIDRIMNYNAPINSESLKDLEIISSTQRYMTEIVELDALLRTMKMIQSMLESYENSNGKALNLSKEMRLLRSYLPIDNQGFQDADEAILKVFEGVGYFEGPRIKILPMKKETTLEDLEGIDAVIVRGVIDSKLKEAVDNRPFLAKIINHRAIHYYSYVKYSDGIYRADDSVITKVENENVPKVGEKDKYIGGKVSYIFFDKQAELKEQERVVEPPKPQEPTQVPPSEERFGENRYTALQLAVYENKEDVVRELVGKGANIIDKDKLGNTALHWAAQRANEVIMKVLLEKATPEMVNVQNKAGDTPLHYATKSFVKGIVPASHMDLLIQKGADIKLPNIEGKTSIDCAKTV